MQAVVDAFVQDVGVGTGIGFPGHTIAGLGSGSVLTKELDMLLCSRAGFIDGLGSLANALGELLLLAFDLSVQALEDREDDGFEGFGGFEVGVGNSLVIEVSCLRVGSRVQQRWRGVIPECCCGWYRTSR